MRDFEYDSFGPWILEINDEDTIPPLFKKFQPSEGKPLLNIKIPRNIDRTNASPGMNLYDYVLYLYDNDILILKRDYNRVVKERFSYDEILYICNSENLLRGELTLGLIKSQFTIHYNTVSCILITRMIEIIRKKNKSEFDYSKVANIYKDINSKLSFQFRGLLNKEKMYSPKVKVMAFQNESAVNTIEKRLFWKFLYKIIGKRVLESMHLCDEQELIILNRVKLFRYRGQAIYSRSSIYIPLNSINIVKWVEDPRDSSIISLQITTGDKTHGSIYLRDNAYLSKTKKSLKSLGF